MSSEKIVLSGPTLEYWKQKSELIRMLEERGNGEVTLYRGDFIPHFPEEEWRFLTELLTNQPFKVGKRFGNSRYGFNEKTAVAMLDYLMVEDPKEMSKSVGEKNAIQPRGQGPQKVRPIEPIDTNSWPDNISEYSYTRNLYSDNEYVPSKKNKYRSNVKINNNNNKKPWAKTRGYRYGRRSSNKTRRR